MICMGCGAQLAPDDRFCDGCGARVSARVSVAAPGEVVVTIGREADNSIVIDSPQVSRHHARVRITSGGMVIEDQGSANGVTLNGMRVQSAALQLNDVVMFGSLQFDATMLAPYLSRQPQVGEAASPGLANYPGDSGMPAGSYAYAEMGHGGQAADAPLPTFLRVIQFGCLAYSVLKGLAAITTLIGLFARLTEVLYLYLRLGWMRQLLIVMAFLNLVVAAAFMGAFFAIRRRLAWSRTLVVGLSAYLVVETLTSLILTFGFIMPALQLMARRSAAASSFGALGAIGGAVFTVGVAGVLLYSAFARKGDWPQA